MGPSPALMTRSVLCVAPGIPGDNDTMIRNNNCSCGMVGVVESSHAMQGVTQKRFVFPAVLAAALVVSTTITLKGR